MKKVKITPVAFIGNCPANLDEEDEFQILGLNVENPGQHKLCFLAFTHFPIMVWQLQSEERFFSHASCPGCTSGMDEENRVVFLLGHADKWGLSQAISEYLSLLKRRREPEEAKLLKEEAIRHQERNEYTEASEKMHLALEIMREGPQR